MSKLDSADKLKVEDDLNLVLAINQQMNSTDSEELDKKFVKKQLDERFQFNRSKKSRFF